MKYTNVSRQLFRGTGRSILPYLHSRTSLPKGNRKWSSLHRSGRRLSSWSTITACTSELDAVHFSDLPLDRAAHLRTQPERVEQLLGSPTTLILPLQSGRALVGATSLLHGTTPANNAPPQTQMSLCLSGGSQLPLQAVSFAHHDAAVAISSNIHGATAAATHLTEAAPAPKPAQAGSDLNVSLTAPRQWVPLAIPVSAVVLQGTQASSSGRPALPDVHAALDPSIDSSMGFVFLGFTDQGEAVFSCELTEPADVLVTSIINEDSLGKSPPNATLLEQHETQQELEQEQEKVVLTAAAETDADAARDEGLSPAGTAAPAQQPSERSMDSPWHWGDVRRVGQRMSGADAAVLALASGLARWHASAAFCTRTGHPLSAVHAGHGRAVLSPPQTPQQPRAGGSTGTTPGSGRVRAVYPRIDPAVIVAATCGDWLLLGRKKAWEKGRYSLLAGFCELGETLEQAAVREVLEESGVRLGPASLAYHSSQPWPFPSSLMIGFVGQAALPPGMLDSYPLQWLTEFGRAAAENVGLTPGEVKRYILPIPPAVQVDEKELEDARWFHRDYLLAALSPPPAAGAAPPQPDGTPHAAEEPKPAQGSPSRRYYSQIPPGDGVRIPGKYALASRIIWGWLSGQGNGRAPGADSQSALNGRKQGQWSPHLMGAGGGDAYQAEAGGGRRGGDGGGIRRDAASLLDLVPDVSIDEGIFKYVLLRVTEISPLHPPSDPAQSDTAAARLQRQPGNGRSGAGGEESGSGDTDDCDVSGSSTDSDQSSHGMGDLVKAGETSQVVFVPSAEEGEGEGTAGGVDGVGGVAVAPPGPPPAAHELERVCSKLVVRGDVRAPYHDDIRRTAASEVASLHQDAPPGCHMSIDTVGGGRIEHYPEQRLISIYGYSSAFGQAPHELTAALLRRWFPFYQIVVSYEGY